MNTKKKSYGIVINGVFYELIASDSCSRCSMKHVCNSEECPCDTAARILGMKNDSYKFVKRTKEKRDTKTSNKNKCIDEAEII